MLEYSNKPKNKIVGYPQTSRIIDEYRKDYEKLKQNIIDNRDDFNKMRELINIIVEKYLWLFELDHKNVFELFKNLAPSAIFAMLTNYSIRHYFLPRLNTNANMNDDVKKMYDYICSISTEVFLMNILGKNLKIFNGKADDWKVIVGKGTRVMLLRVSPGAFVRTLKIENSNVNTNNFFAAEGINNKFYISDGIE